MNRKAWDHKLRKLASHELAYGWQCSKRLCKESATHLGQYTYVRGHRAVTTTRHVQLCEGHAHAFAESNGLEWEDG